MNRIGGVIVCVFTSSAVDHGYNIDRCCFYDKNAALRRKNKN
jgi:hypothetical protein